MTLGRRLPRRDQDSQAMPSPSQSFALGLILGRERKATIDGHNVDRRLLVLAELEVCRPA
jgi:hypothetical protein